MVRFTTDMCIYSHHVLLSTKLLLCDRKKFIHHVRIHSSKNVSATASVKYSLTVRSALRLAHITMIKYM